LLNNRVLRCLEPLLTLSQTCRRLAYSSSTVDLQSLKGPWSPHTWEVHIIYLDSSQLRRTTLDEWPDRLKRLYEHRTTQHRNTRINIHVLGGIRTHDLSDQALKTQASGTRPLGSVVHVITPWIHQWPINVLLPQVKYHCYRTKLYYTSTVIMWHFNRERKITSTRNTASKKYINDDDSLLGYIAM
jgi:hypothetical protein